MLKQAKSIFIIGIKGAAMANIAVILKKLGKTVSGTDVDEQFITDSLLKTNNITYAVGFDSKLINKNIDLVVYSAAHGGENNPLVITAKNIGIQSLHQAELLGQLLRLFKTSIAVCGCHGKTTTSSLLAYALLKLGVKPSYMIGSSDFNHYPGGDYASKDYFVIEADEYAINPPHNITPKFNFLNPDYILCTNIDFDHPDVYQDLETTKEAFLKFFGNKKLTLCADDNNLSHLVNKLKQDQYLTYGFSPKADLQIVNPEYNNDTSSFELIWRQKSLGKYKISLFGEKNISNAAGVILTLLQLGFDPEKIKKAIQDFTGAKRRFEKIYEKNDVYIFDDYAHHPNEIEATIKAARNRFPGKKIIIIFQPHTYSRTQSLLPEFAKQLSLADQAYILPIFPSAREDSSKFTVSSKDIAKINPQKLKSIENKNDLLLSLKSFLLNPDILSQSIIFTMGAGDVYKLSDDIIKVIANVKSQSSNLN